MKLVRFATGGGGGPRYGIWRHDHIRALTGNPFEGVAETSERHAPHEVTLLAPCNPTKIVAVGLNYRDHAAELGMTIPEEPLVFLKPPSAVIGPGDTIRIPAVSSQVEHEAELAVVIARKAGNVPPEDAGSVILGFTCLNDVTARDLQKKDVQFTRAKSFDTFCPVGPWIETGVDASDLAVECRVNGELRQSSRTSRLIHGVEKLVSFVSSIMTLEPGDIISTGTPSGVGKLEPGDTVSVTVEGIGTLENRVEAERI